MSRCELCGQNGSNDSVDSIPVHKKCWYELCNKAGYYEAIKILKMPKREPKLHPAFTELGGM